MELPNVVSVARAWTALFRCQLNPVRSLVPPPIEAVPLRANRALLAVTVLDCEQSSLGRYQQVSIGFACRHRPWLTPPLAALWLERKVSDFGYWTEFCATSTELAQQADITHWGYPSFVADIDIQVKRSKMRTVVSEKGVEILRFEMKRPGAGMPIHFPWRTYSKVGNEVVRTEMSVDAVGRERSLLISSNLTLNRHDKVEDLRSVSIESDVPLEVRWYDSLRTRIDGPSARFRAK